MRHTTRGAALTLAAILSLALVLPAAATEPTTTGVPECDFKVAAVFPSGDVDPESGDGPILIATFQHFIVYGTGFPATTILTLNFFRTGQSEHFDVLTDAAGEFQDDFFFYPDAGPATNVWHMNLHAPFIGCQDSLELTAHEGFFPPPFFDAVGHPFEDEINWLFWNGITTGGGGCAGSFCPESVVTREQMASFLVRALGLPLTGTDSFTDDEASVHEGDINRLAASGITTGCTATRFCPTQPVTRQEMASFLVRAIDLPSAGTDPFTDDETSVHEADINALAASGITTGCTATMFCPTAGVSRGQMAAFLFRAAPHMGLCCDNGITQ